MNPQYSTSNCRESYKIYASTYHCEIVGDFQISSDVFQEIICYSDDAYFGYLYQEHKALYNIGEEIYPIIANIQSGVRKPLE